VIPGLLLFLLNAVIAKPDYWPLAAAFGGLCVAAFMVMWNANQDAARKLQEQIDELESEGER
jgi:hypothetical protein